MRDRPDKFFLYLFSKFNISLIKFKVPKTLLLIAFLSSFHNVSFYDRAQLIMISGLYDINIFLIWLVFKIFKNFSGHNIFK